MADLNPLTLGDTPEDFTELPDGSVEIFTEEVVVAEQDFYENLAERLPTNKLNAWASELCELVEKDKESRKKRDKQYEEGLRRTGLGDDAPGGAEFDGASRVVHPVLAEACVDFSSRAIKELFPAQGPVKTYIAGETTPQKLDRAERKRRFMNWQLTTQIEEYRGELEQLLTQLPMGGSQYLKFYHCERERRVKVEFVPIDDVFLPYAATNFYTSPRVTHRQLLTRYEFNRRVNAGLYQDGIFVDTQSNAPEESASAEANDKIEGREETGYNEDGLRAVLEIHLHYEIPEDELTGGEYAPYIITVDEETEKILSIYRNWRENDPRFKKLDWFVEWKFIPWRGAYAVGLPHLIGGLSAALTGALRALLDSAHINNAPTMLKLKSGRIVGQNTQVNVTQVCDIEGPAGIDDIKKLAMAMPFNPPSPVLAQLMDSLYGLAKGVIATSHESLNNVGDRTPVGTTMALIESGSTTYSAIHARLHESQKKALQILHRLDADYLEAEDYAEDFGEVIVTKEDFSGSLDVIPVSDPTIFSEAQRFAQVQSLIQMAADQSVPWNKLNVYRRALKQMRIEAIDELLPAQKDPVTNEPLTENFLALHDGTPIKAAQQQDHMGHVQAHLAYISAPWVLQNPQVPPQAVQGVVAHINEHILMLYTGAVQATAAQVQQFAAMQGQMVTPEQAQFAALQQVVPALQQQLAPVLQQLAQVQQALQQRTPPTPLPSEVQASVQIAQMEVQRKTQADSADQQLQQAKLQLQQAQVQFQQQMEAQRTVFDQQLAQVRAQQEVAIEQLRQQVEVMKNQRDNEQKQNTELMKNKDDNDTKVLIATQQNDRELLQGVVEQIVQAKTAAQTSSTDVQ